MIVWLRNIFLCSLNVSGICVTLLRQNHLSNSIKTKREMYFFIHHANKNYSEEFPCLLFNWIEFSSFISFPSLKSAEVQEHYYLPIKLKGIFLSILLIFFPCCNSQLLYFHLICHSAYRAIYFPTPLHTHKYICI